MKPDDICPRPDALPPQATQPLSPAIHLATVYRCEDPEQAAQILAGEAAGHVYRRDGHPNAVLLAEKCRELHGAERAAICASGMSALAALVLSELTSGDHLVVSDQLYGRSLELLTGECARLGIASTVVDTCDVAATRAAIAPNTKLVVAETITNPLLRVSDIRALADAVHAGGAQLVIDNTFASPAVCRPLELGADWVVESLTKIMNGHSDVLLGAICGRAAAWQRIPRTLSVWGLASSPFDCWLAARGLGTLALRVERACENAMSAARFLAVRGEIERVDYPGLPTHVDHALAVRQFGHHFGTIVTFSLRGGLDAARTFIRAAQQIPFCPSLGELSTTLSHPASTSHRALAPERRVALGITDGTIRLSVGIESAEQVRGALEQALAGQSA
jgi:cystathionine beta-lyase/cystathionine gamma-synthase